MPAALNAAPTVNAVLNGASFSGDPIAPGTIVSIFGTGLAPDVFVPDQLPLPSSLAGTTVTVDGVPVPLFFVSPNQINAQLPFVLPAGPATLTVRDGAGATSSIQIEIGAASPAVFTTTADGKGDAIATHADFSLVEPAFGANAQEGEVIILFCTGLGDVDNVPSPGAPSPSSPLARTSLLPEVFMDGRPAEVLFAGLAPGFIGLYQINLKVPDGVGGDVVTIVRSSGAESNEVLINVAGTFFLHSGYVGPLESRSNQSKFSLRMADFQAVDEFNYTGSYTVSDDLGLLDSGIVELEASIPFLAVLRSDSGEVLEALLDTLDAGRSFQGFLFAQGDSPENWIASFDLSFEAPEPPAPPPPDLPGTALDCALLEGALIFADDGTFLGKITRNTFDQDSIGATLGPHGSSTSQVSIFNRFWKYGDSSSQQSAFNDFASRPPVIYINGNAVAFLTTNDFKQPRVDPRALLPCVGR